MSKKLTASSFVFKAMKALDMWPKLNKNITPQEALEILKENVTVELKSIKLNDKKPNNPNLPKSSNNKGA